MAEDEVDDNNGVLQSKTSNDSSLSQAVRKPWILEMHTLYDGDGLIEAASDRIIV